MSQKKLFNDNGKGESYTPSSTGGQFARCYESHPALDVGEFKIYGGSCFSPIVDDADVYIGLDSGMKISRVYPWDEEDGPIKVLFPIRDMHAPDDVEGFKKMIDWIIVQLISHKKVHVGCIGGHGRTGTVFAALVASMMQEKDAITYVRKHYCEKVVESQEQINFLSKHYGVTPVKPTKGHGHFPEYVPPKKNGKAPAADWWKDTGRYSQQRPAAPLLNGAGLPTGVMDAYPTTNPCCLWGDSVRFDHFDKQAKADTIEPSGVEASPAK